MIDWGPFEGLGNAAAGRSRLGQRGMFPFTPDEGRVRFEQILAAGALEAGPVEVDYATWLRTHPQVAGSPLLAGLANAEEAPGGTVDRALLDELRRLPARKRGARLTVAITEAIASVMRLELAAIRPTTPLEELGLDSLMGLELANRLGSMLGLELAATTLWNFPSPAELATHLEDRLGLDEQVAGPPSESPDPKRAVDAALASKDDVPEREGLEGRADTEEEGDEALLLAKMESLSALLDR